MTEQAGSRGAGTAVEDDEVVSVGPAPVESLSVSTTTVIVDTASRGPGMTILPGPKLLVVVETTEDTAGHGGFTVDLNAAASPNSGSEGMDIRWRPSLMRSATFGSDGFPREASAVSSTMFSVEFGEFAASAEEVVLSEAELQALSSVLRIVSPEPGLSEGSPKAKRALGHSRRPSLQVALAPVSSGVPAHPQRDAAAGSGLPPTVPKD